MNDADFAVAAVLVGGVALVALGLGIYAATSGPEHDYTTMCQNADYIRLEDVSCDRGDRGSFVMYIATNSNYHAPAVGDRIDQSRVVKTVPSGKTVQKGAIAAQGGVVKSSPGIIRNGFGGKSGSAS